MKRARSPRSERRGGVAVIVAAGLVMLVGFGAIVIDIGHFRLVDAELQNGGDAASLAGAQMLDRTVAGVALARVNANRFAFLNEADNSAINDVDMNEGNDPAGDIVVGKWDFTARSFTPTTEPLDVNAVQVRTARTSARGTAVDAWLGKIFGVNEASVEDYAIAAGGGPACKNAFPIMLPECAIFNPDGSLKCSGEVLRLSPDWIDNAGLTSLGDASASVTTVRDWIRNYDPRNPCNSAVRDEIRVMNGNPMNAIAPAIRELLDPDGDGVQTPVLVYLPVVESNIECQLRYVQSFQTTGYAAFELLNITRPPDQTISGTLRCELLDGGPAGGEYYGLRGQTRLVR